MTTETPVYPQTPRRSRRGQPAVAFLPRSDDDISLLTKIYERPAEPNDTIDPAEGFQIDSRTTFYKSFSRRAEAAPKYARGGSSGKATKKKKGSTYYGTFSVGDTVLVNTSGNRTIHPSIGVIAQILATDEDPSTTRVRIHWFLRPSELPRIRAKHDHTPDEVFFTLDRTSLINPEQIIRPCLVSQSALVQPSSPSKRARNAVQLDDSDSDDEEDRKFICRLAIDPTRGLYYQFDWQDHWRNAMATQPHQPEWATVWMVPTLHDFSASLPQQPKKVESPARKRRKVESESGAVISQEPQTPSKSRVKSSSRQSHREASVEYVPGSESEESEEEPLVNDLPEPKTPSRARRRDPTSAPITPSRSPRKRVTLDSPSKPKTPGRPRQSAKKIAQPTPHTKARVDRRRVPTVVRAAPPQFASSQQLSPVKSADPWLRAMNALHVASRPDVLRCREDEHAKVLRSVEQLVEEGSGGCVYISGVPGTGKTATVHAVIRELRRLAERNEANPFTYVEINGLRLTDPSSAYCALWEAISGHDAETDGHLKISSKEALRRLEKHFTRSGNFGPGGHACVVLMDELDQLVTAKQDVVYNFFNWPTLIGSKLIVVAVANTMDLPERVMSGRVRSRLGMIRINFQPYTTPQLEAIVHARLANAQEGMPEKFAKEVIHKDGIKFAAMKVSSISGDARRVLDICRRAVELVHEDKRTARTDDVKEVIKAMQNSPTAAYLRECSFHERLMLASLVKCVKRAGVEEIQWGEVQHQLLTYLPVLASTLDATRRPSAAELSLVLESLVASRAMLLEDNAVVSRKPDGERRVMLNFEMIEVERVLGEVGGTTWKNVLST